MISIYSLSRIVKTESENLKFIWSDEYNEIHEPEWRGFFRGVVSGYDANGAYERYDGTSSFGNETVLESFLGNGGVLEPYIPADPEEDEE